MPNPKSIVDSTVPAPRKKITWFKGPYSLDSESLGLIYELDQLALKPDWWDCSVSETVNRIIKDLNIKYEELFNAAEALMESLHYDDPVRSRMFDIVQYLRMTQTCPEEQEVCSIGFD